MFRAHDLKGSVHSCRVHYKQIFQTRMIFIHISIIPLGDASVSSYLISISRIPKKNPPIYSYSIQRLVVKKHIISSILKMDLKQFQSYSALSYNDQKTPFLAESSAKVPSSATRPSSKTMILSASLIVERRCATMTVVLPFWASSSAFCTSSSLSLSSALVASSRSRIFLFSGGPKMDRAIAIRWPVTSSEFHCASL